jgi:hypothetical protein
MQETKETFLHNATRKKELNQMLIFVTTRSSVKYKESDANDYAIVQHDEDDDDDEPAEAVCAVDDVIAVSLPAGAFAAVNKCFHGNSAASTCFDACSMTRI